MSQRNLNDTEEKVDLLYTAFNRLEFVKITLPLLIKNTNWNLIRFAYIVDDGSIDGTCEYISRSIKHIPKAIFKKNKKKARADFVSAQAKIFNQFLLNSIEKPSPKHFYIAKIDSDVALPPKWLDRFIEVMERYSSLYFVSNLYGFRFQKNRLVKKNNIGFYQVNAVGGIGVFRREAFIKLGFPEIEEKFLFNFQLKAKNYNMKSGFIYPPYDQIVLLDSLKEFDKLSKKYIKRGWMRANSIKKMAEPPNWFKNLR